MTNENQTKTEISNFIMQEPHKVLLSKELTTELFSHIKKEIEEFKPNVENDVGRAAIKKLAYKITRTKTALDAAGKDANSELREKISAVDAIRRNAREKLDGLAVLARLPLTKYERELELKQEAISEFMKNFNGLKNAVNSAFSSSVIEEALHRLKQLDPRNLTSGDELETILNEIDSTISFATSKFQNILQQEETEKENKRLKEEAKKRDLELEQLKLKEQAQAQRLKDEELEKERLAAQEEEKAAEQARVKAEQEAKQEALAQQNKEDERKRKELEEIANRKAQELASLEEHAFVKISASLDQMGIDVLVLEQRDLLIDIVSTIQDIDYSEINTSLHHEIASKAGKIAGVAQSKVDEITKAQELEADKQGQAKRNSAIRASLVDECAIGIETATAIVKAILSGKIPYVKITPTD